MIQVFGTILFLFSIAFLATLLGIYFFDRVKLKRQNKKSTVEDTENNISSE